MSLSAVWTTQGTTVAYGLPVLAVGEVAFQKLNAANRSQLVVPWGVEVFSF